MEFGIPLFLPIYIWWLFKKRPNRRFKRIDFMSSKFSLLYNRWSGVVEIIKE